MEQQWKEEDVPQDHRHHNKGHHFPGTQTMTMTMTIAILMKIIVTLIMIKATKVTISIMFYYTADLLRKTPDMEGFLDHLIAQQNQAFVNSKVPVRVFKFCSRKETVPALTC